MNWICSDRPPAPSHRHIRSRSAGCCPPGVQHLQRLLRRKGPQRDLGIVELRLTLGHRRAARPAAPDHQPGHVFVLGQPGEEGEPLPRRPGPVAAGFGQDGLGSGGQGTASGTGKAGKKSHRRLQIGCRKDAGLPAKAKGRETRTYPASRRARARVPARGRSSVTICPSRTTCRPSTIRCRTRVGPHRTSAATGSQDPAASTPRMSQIARSARFPAPPTQDHRAPAPARRPASRSPAPRARHRIRPRATRCNSIAIRASATRLPASFEADPSTPNPTFTPASRIARTGAIPDPSLQFEHGQCATPVRAG
jgi:hypothetical protein